MLDDTCATRGAVSRLCSQAACIQSRLLTMDSPVWFHLLPQHGQVVVAQHSCVQRVDTSPWVARSMSGLTVVLDGYTGEHQIEAGGTVI